MAGPIERHLKELGRVCILMLGLAVIGMGVFGLLDFDRRDAVIGNPLWIISIVIGVACVLIARPINLFLGGGYQQRPRTPQTEGQKTLRQLFKILIGVLFVSLLLTLIGSRMSSGVASTGSLLFDIFGTLALVAMVAIWVIWSFLIDHEKD